MNPLLKSYKHRLCYAAFWLCAAAVQVLIMLRLPIDRGYMLLDVLTYTALYAFLTLLLWYPFRFNRKDKNTWRHFLFIHFILANSFLVLWQGVGYALVTLLTNSDAGYQQFLISTMPWRMVFGALIYLIAMLGFSILDFVDQLRKKAANELRLTEAIRDSELKLLKSQINPHFLFNSLNSVNLLILQDAEKAREMVVALSDFLRYTVLSTNQSMMSVAQEVENVQRYLSIEKLRFGDKLAYSFEVSPEALQVKMPSMMLQPLFENAVKHGVCESLQAVQVWTKVALREGCIFVEVVNDVEQGVSAKKGSGTGLKNISERLRLLYGNSASMQVRRAESRFSVTLQIPIEVKQ